MSTGREFKITIKTEQDGTGAKQTAEDLRQISEQARDARGKFVGLGESGKEAAGKLAEGAKKAGEGVEELGGKFEHHLVGLLNQAGMGQLEELLHNLFSPMLLAGAGVLEIFEQLKKRQEMIHEQNLKLIEDTDRYNEAIVDGQRKAETAQRERADANLISLQKEREAVDLLTLAMQDNVKLIGDQLQATESLIAAEARLSAMLTKNHTQGPTGELPSQAAAEAEAQRERQFTETSAAEDAAHIQEMQAKAGRMPGAAQDIIDANTKAKDADARMTQADDKIGRANADLAMLDEKGAKTKLDETVTGYNELTGMSIEQAQALAKQWRSQGKDPNRAGWFQALGPAQETIAQQQTIINQGKKDREEIADYTRQRQAAENDYNSANDLAAKRRQLIESLTREMDESNEEYRVKTNSRDRIEAINRQAATAQIAGMKGQDASALESRARELISAPIWTRDQFHSNISDLQSLDRLLTLMENQFKPGIEQGQLMQTQRELENRLANLEAYMRATGL